MRIADEALFQSVHLIQQVISRYQRITGITFISGDDGVYSSVVIEILRIEIQWLCGTGFEWRVESIVSCQEIKIAIAIHIARYQAAEPSGCSAHAFKVHLLFHAFFALQENAHGHPVSGKQQVRKFVTIQICPAGIGHHACLTQQRTVLIGHVCKPAALISQNIAASALRIPSRQACGTYEDILIAVQVDISRTHTGSTYMNFRKCILCRNKVSLSVVEQKLRDISGA